MVKLMDPYIPLVWQESCEFEPQLRFVAIILTPNARKRFANSIPIFPNPRIKTCITEENQFPRTIYDDDDYKNV